jgi:predicted membrane-bound spermidine synthase
MTRRRFLFLAFFVSGFCGLVYQVIWLRLAFASFGVITPVLSVVVSTFMLGLSLGSWLAGRGIDRWTASSGRSAIFFYGLAEILIGVGGLSVPWLFSQSEGYLLWVGETDSAAYLIHSALAMALSILPWCICMGATFPTMMAYVRQAESNETSFSYLYLANVLGAAGGAGLSALVLIELFGFAATSRLAVLLNLSLGIACLFVARSHGATPIKEDIPEPREVSHSTWAGSILFVTGFGSMALEVVWTRAFTPVMETTVYAFAALLVTYLIATGLGSFLYRRDLAQGTIKSMSRLLGGLAASSFLPPLMNDPRIHASPVLAALSIVPFCAILGYVTPRLVDEFSGGRPRRAGVAYAVNVVGCILGPLVAGYGMLPFWGVKTALVVLAAPFVLLYVLSFREWTDSMPARAAGLIASAALLGACVLWTRSYEAAEPGEVRRDYTATVVATGEGMKKRLLVNGVGKTFLTPITKMMAHYPLASHSGEPQSIAVICFGMGTTYRSALTWGIQVTAIELVPGVRDSFGYYFEDASTFLRHPNGRIVIDDGRRFLKRTNEKFDVITIDPPPPVEAAGTSLLYSREFYRVLKSRLKEGGILAQWFPGGDAITSQAVTRAILQEFPHVKICGSMENWGHHYLASLQPIPERSPDELTSRMPAAARSDAMEWHPGSTPSAYYSIMLKNSVPAPLFFIPDWNVEMTDDRALNEYYLIRRAYWYGPWMKGAAVAFAALFFGLAAFIVVRRPK